MRLELLYACRSRRCWAEGVLGESEIPSILAQAVKRANHSAIICGVMFFPSSFGMSASYVRVTLAESEPRVAPPSLERALRRAVAKSVIASSWPVRLAVAKAAIIASLSARAAAALASRSMRVAAALAAAMAAAI